jgi:hypothetical protein
MKYANQYGYTDIKPHEITRTVSPKCLEIRLMLSERDLPIDLGFEAGGFFGHCADQHRQQWTITSDNSAPIFRIRLGANGWKSATGQQFQLSEKPRRFYDFNF